MLLTLSSTVQVRHRGRPERLCKKWSTMEVVFGRLSVEVLLCLSVIDLLQCPAATLDRIAYLRVRY